MKRTDIQSVRLYLLALLLLMCSSAFGQDPIFSQYFSQKLYLNPAFSGYEPGTVVSTATRRQWGNLASNPLTDYGANFITNHIEWSQDLPAFHSGIGVALTDNAEGEGQYHLTRPNEGLLRWQRATFSYAFHSWDCDFYENLADEIWGFSIGGYASYNRFVLDWQNLVFGNQLDPIYGVVRSSGVPRDIDGISDVEDWDFGIGTVIHVNLTDRNLARVGLAMHHIDLPNNSVVGNEERLPMRFTIHGSDIIQIGRGGGKNGSDRFQVIPNFRLELQRASAAWNRALSFPEKAIVHQDLSIGVMGKTPAAGSARLSIGAWYNGNFRGRNINPTMMRGPEHSLIGYVGMDVVTTSGNGNATSVWELGLSWDRNLAGIQSVGDIFELTFSMGLPQVTLPGAGCSSCKQYQIRNRF